MTQLPMTSGDENFLHDGERRWMALDLSSDKQLPMTSGATRAAARLAEKLTADLKRLGPLRDTVNRQQVRREKRKAAKKGAKR